MTDTMTNNKKQSGEQAVLSRRLRPIYGNNFVVVLFYLLILDAIDSGKNKNAIQEADKVLKKHPNTSIAKVHLIYLCVIKIIFIKIAFLLINLDLK